MKYTRPHTHHLTVGMQMSIRQIDSLLRKIGDAHKSDEDWRVVYENLNRARYHINDAMAHVKFIAEYNRDLKGRIK